MTKSKTEKQFQLDGSEINFVSNINRRRDQALLDFFSYYAMNRGYKVTEQTQFRTDAEGILYITELEEEAKSDDEVAVA